LNKDNISAIVTAVAVVVVVIIGIEVYFNSPALNKGAASQQQLEEFVSAATTTNKTIKTIMLNNTQFLQIDKSQLQKAPEFTQYG